MEISNIVKGAALLGVGLLFFISPLVAGEAAGIALIVYLAWTHLVPHKKEDSNGSP